MSKFLKLMGVLMVLVSLMFVGCSSEEKDCKKACKDHYSGEELKLCEQLCEETY